jgi:glycosyltransferase involved in cell wall biosynthesis
MKIGYDAKRFFNNATGLGNYSRTLVHTLAKYHPEHEYHLFTPKMNASIHQNLVEEYVIEAAKSKGGANVLYPHLPEGFNNKTHPLWRSYFIKKDLQKADIQLFHGLSGELPLSIPKGMKTVVTIHDLIHERYPQFYPFFDRKMYSWKFKNACKKADVVVAISEQTKHDIIDFYNIPESKIKVIYQSCDPRFRAVRTSNLAPDYFFRKYDLPNNYLLYVGTINERKNLMSLLRAFAAYESKNVKLVIVGWGGNSVYFNKVISFIYQNKLVERVKLVPNVSSEDLPFIYKNALALVYPSFFEGFGIPIIEALWSGCPVITSKGSCFAEAGGRESLYINPEDSDGIYTSIYNLMEDNALRQRMITKGLEHVQQFDEQLIGNQWITLYESLL